MGCSPWGHKESDTTEQVSTHRWDCWAFQMMLVVKSLPAKAVDLRGAGLIPSQEDRLELGKATHSSILAWRISWTEEPGGL